jgi:hypothetical protein
VPSLIIRERPLGRGRLTISATVVLICLRCCVCSDALRASCRAPGGATRSVWLVSVVDIKLDSDDYEQHLHSLYITMADLTSVSVSDRCGWNGLSGCNRHGRRPVDGDFGRAWMLPTIGPGQPTLGGSLSAGPGLWCLRRTRCALCHRKPGLAWPTPGRRANAGPRHGPRNRPAPP